MRKLKTGFRWATYRKANDRESMLHYAMPFFNSPDSTIRLLAGCGVNFPRWAIIFQRRKLKLLDAKTKDYCSRCFKGSGKEAAFDA